MKNKALVRFRFIAFSTKRFLIEFIDLTSNYLSSYDFVPTVFLMNPLDQTKGNIFYDIYYTKLLIETCIYRVSHPNGDNFGLNFLFFKTTYFKK